MNNNTLSTSFTRLMRVLAAISIVPALFLPFYQAFLHGGRGAVDIIPRSGTYALVHMLGAFCILLAMFGLIALYLRYHDQMGRIAPLCFILSILAQALFAGLVFIDGFYMPTLAHFDPATQTLLHSADYFTIVGHHPASDVLRLGAIPNLPEKQYTKGCSHWTWWINRPALSRPTSGRFFVMRQSRETFSSRSQAPSECFCEHLHPSPRDMTLHPL